MSGITARATARLAGRPALVAARVPSRAVARARAGGASRELADRLLRRRPVSSAFGLGHSSRVVFRLPHHVVRAEADARAATAPLAADIDVSSAPAVVDVERPAGSPEVADARSAAALDLIEVDDSVAAEEEAASVAAPPPQALLPPENGATSAATTTHAAQAAAVRPTP